MTVLRSGSATHVGRVRPVNEDALLEMATLFAVADGMGGHVGGAVASQVAIEALAAAFANSRSPDGLLAAVQAANRAVYERSVADAGLRGMGTTLIAAALVDTPAGERIMVVNVGDSRGYVLHAGSLEQLTTDHSVAEEMVARGELTEAEAATHPHRHILTRALGIGDDVEVDTVMRVPEEGDRYLLCSDGLTNELDEAAIEAVLRSHPEPSEAARVLVERANDAGGADNITVVVVDVALGPSSDRLAPDVFAAAGERGNTDEHARAPAPLERSPQAAGEAATTALDVPSEGRIGPGRATPGPLPPRLSHLPTAASLVGAPVGRPLVGSPTAVPLLDAPTPASLVTPTSDASSSRRSWRIRRRRHGLRQPRWLTLRVAMFVIVLAALIGAAYGVSAYYVEHSYFVQLTGQQLVIYRGRIGGFLWWHPAAVVHTGVSAADVLATRLADLREGVEEPSLSAARRYVRNLVAEADALRAPEAPVPSAPNPGAPAPTTSLGPAGASQPSR
jgi:serine/threonine protein phosphatase PrpC